MIFLNFFFFFLGEEKKEFGNNARSFTLDKLRTFTIDVVPIAGVSNIVKFVR